MWFLRRGERGSVTSVEAFVLAVMTAIVVAIALPSYVALRDRANDSTARAHAREAAAAAETYRVESGSYAGLSVAALVEIDPDLRASGLRIERSAITGVCIEANAGGRTWHALRPAGTVSGGGCP